MGPFWKAQGVDPKTRKVQRSGTTSPESAVEKPLPTRFSPPASTPVRKGLLPSEHDVQGDAQAPQVHGLRTNGFSPSDGPTARPVDFPSKRAGFLNQGVKFSKQPVESCLKLRLLLTPDSTDRWIVRPNVKDPDTPAVYSWVPNASTRKPLLSGGGCPMLQNTSLISCGCFSNIWILPCNPENAM